jgi:hypothetical protein
MLLGLRADLERLEPKFREGADIDVVDPRVAAQLFIRRNKFTAVPLGKSPSILGIGIRTENEFVADAPVSLSVFV